MHFFWTILLGVVAAFWILYGGYCLIRIQGIPRLSDFPPETGEARPLVSVLVAARNEAPILPRALPTLVAGRLTEDEPGGQGVQVDRDSARRSLSY